MEAHVLDSKNFFIRTLNVDTRFRSNYSGTTATDFTYHLPNPLKNIIRLRLTSCEIPNTEYLFTYITLAAISAIFLACPAI